MDFEDYVRARAHDLTRFAALVCHDRHTAEDIVQEVLTRAHRHWDRIMSTAYPHAYVRRMIVNEALCWQRKWGRIEPRTEAGLDRPVRDHAAQSADRDELVRAIRQLPGRQRAAIVLRFFEDLTDAEIADALGCREVTVRGYIHRALTALRIAIPEAEPAILNNGGS